MPSILSLDHHFSSLVSFMDTSQWIWRVPSKSAFRPSSSSPHPLWQDKRWYETTRESAHELLSSEKKMLSLVRSLRSLTGTYTSVRKQTTSIGTVSPHALYKFWLIDRTSSYSSRNGWVSNRPTQSLHFDSEREFGRACSRAMSSFRLTFGEEIHYTLTLSLNFSSFCFHPTLQILPLVDTAHQSQGSWRFMTQYRLVVCVNIWEGKGSIYMNMKNLGFGLPGEA